MDTLFWHTVSPFFTDFWPRCDQAKSKHNHRQQPIKLLPLRSLHCMRNMPTHHETRPRPLLGKRLSSSSIADWFKAGVARLRAGPTSLGIALRVYDSQQTPLPPPPHFTDQRACHVSDRAWMPPLPPPLPPCPMSSTTSESRTCVARTDTIATAIGS